VEVMARLPPQSRVSPASQPMFWVEAQREELVVWKKATNSASAVLTELEDVAQMVEFGLGSDLIGQPQSVIELGIGPLGIGWGAFVPANYSVGVDTLPRLKVDTGISSLDSFGAALQERVRFVQADASRALKFPSNTFDLVVCDNVIDHAQDPDAILSEARRLVTDGGRLLLGVNVFSAVGILKWRYVTKRLHPRDSNTVCHPHSFTAASLARLLDQTGWRCLASSPRAAVARRVGRAYRLRLVAMPTDQTNGHG
jgi:SAM-dependent methyltransferase